jgi:hypothetical protein
LVTGRLEDIDDDLKDLWLAQSIMADLMPWVIEAANTDFDKAQENKFHDNKQSLKDYFGEEVSLWWPEQVTVDTINRSTLNFGQKASLLALIQYAQRFPKDSNWKDPTLEGKGDQEQKDIMTQRLVLLAQHVQKDLLWDFQTFADNKLWNTSDHLWLGWINKDIYDLYRDMKGIWYFNLSDENPTIALVEATKMTAVIVRALAASVASALLKKS